MAILLIVDRPRDVALHVSGVEIVAARSYLTDARFSNLRGTKVFNLCRSYRYQSLGYYVSLLATARGHRPLPAISTMQDMKSQTIVRFVSDDLDELIQKSLAPIQSKEFALSIYFGRNLARRHDRLARELFNLFPAPVLRAEFSTLRGRWVMQSIGPMAANDIPPEHHAFFQEAATEHFAGRGRNVRKRVPSRFDLAILHNPHETDPPSDEPALKRFIRAAARLGIHAELIEKDQYAEIAEYDGLFIRETTNVNHHTYRFASRAAAEGMVVMDDPESILKCTNKVYLAELLDHHRVRTPRTRIVHRDNMEAVAMEMGQPCILKQPDSAFSQGVIKVEGAAEFLEQAERLLDRSELIIAQEFLPTNFDWRVGVLDGKPLYVCKYYMAHKHWQIIKRDKKGRIRSGRYETITTMDAPKGLVETAVRAANLVGKGLYGVDVKQSGKRFYVIEINDNPSIEAGCEDAVLKNELYDRVMRCFLERMEQRAQGLNHDE